MAICIFDINSSTIKQKKEQKRIMLTVHIWQLFFDLALPEVKSFINPEKKIHFNLRAARFNDVTLYFIHSKSQFIDGDGRTVMTHCMMMALNYACYSSTGD